MARNGEKIRPCTIEIGFRIKLFEFFDISKCWPFVTEDSGSIDTLHNKVGVSSFKYEDRCPDSNCTFKLDFLTQWEARRCMTRISSPGLVVLTIHLPRHSKKV